MTSPVRRISVEALVSDIRAGLDVQDLMRKYALSGRQIKAVFKKLVETSAIDEFEFAGRFGETPTDQELTDESLSGRTPTSGSPVSLKQEPPKDGPHQDDGVLCDESPTPLNTGLPCPACRTPYTEEYAFCPHCGVPLHHKGTRSSADLKIEESTDPGRESHGKELGSIVRSKWESVLSILRNTDQPMTSYVWRAWLISTIPTFLILGPIAGGMALLMGYTPPKLDLPLGFLIFAVLFFAPFVESLMMLPILWVLKRLIRNPLWVAVASAVIWGVLHGLHNLVQGVVITWAFFVLSLCFLEWEKKSKLTGIGVTALVHMCHNTLPLCALALVILFGGEASEYKATQCPPAPPLRMESAVHFSTGGFSLPKKVKDEPSSPAVPWITKNGGIDLGALPIEPIMRQALKKDQNLFRSACEILASMCSARKREAEIFLYGL